MDKETRCKCFGGPLDNSCDELVVVEPISRRQLRALAFHYMYAIDRGDYTETVGEVAEKFKEFYGLTAHDNAFVLTMVQGVIENQARYQKMLQPILEHWPVDRLGCCTRLILCTAMWEFEQEDSIVSVIINEAVEMAKAFAEKDAYRFINGVLDQVQKRYPHLSKVASSSASVDTSSSSESSSSSAESSGEDEIKSEPSTSDSSVSE